MKSPVTCPQLRPTVLAFRVKGTDTAAILEGQNQAELTDNDTGDYTLTLAEPSQRTPVILGITPEGADLIPHLKDVSETAIRVGFEDVAGDPADADFHIGVMVFGSQDEI